jgi:hypothetical protein
VVSMMRSLKTDAWRRIADFFGEHLAGAQR